MASVRCGLNSVVPHAQFSLSHCLSFSFFVPFSPFLLFSSFRFSSRSSLHSSFRFPFRPFFPEAPCPRTIQVEPAGDHSGVPGLRRGGGSENPTHQRPSCQAVDLAGRKERSRSYSSPPHWACFAESLTRVRWPAGRPGRCMRSATGPAWGRCEALRARMLKGDLS